MLDNKTYYDLIDENLFLESEIYEELLKLSRSTDPVILGRLANHHEINIRYEINQHIPLTILKRLINDQESHIKIAAIRNYRNRQPKHKYFKKFLKGLIK